MRLQIRHVTSYQYSKSVFLEPHYLHLHPLQRPYLFVESYALTIDPSPSGQSRILDIFDNPTEQLWFNELENRLDIIVDMVVNTSTFNPFGFLQHPSTDLSQEVIYGSEHGNQLKPFLELDRETITREMATLVARLKKAANNDILQFVTLLLEDIYNGWDHHVRLHADVWTPEFCYVQKKGSCRDLAWMMINMLRFVGLASRFVSGYSFNPELEEGHELHAWLEVLIPGGGWIGVDPGLGLFVTDHFVPLAVGSEPQYTMPVIGSFRGSASSELTSNVEMKELG